MRQGLAGSFSQLLDVHPELERLVRKMIDCRDVLLTQKGDRVYVKNLRVAHNRFVAACRSAGLSHIDYPLNQDEQGRRALARALRNRMLVDFSDAHRSCGRRTPETGSRPVDAVLSTSKRSI